MCVENCSNRKINVLVSGCPRTNADSHGGPPSPCGASAPACTGILDQSDDAPRPIVIPESDDYLIQNNLVQDFDPGWMPTLTAEIDIPVRAAVSATEAPSIFTY